MSSVADVLDAVWAVVSWLELAPFALHPEYVAFSKKMVGLSIQLATSASRDRFAERPVDVIR